MEYPKNHKVELRRDDDSVLISGDRAIPDAWEAGSFLEGYRVEWPQPDDYSVTVTYEGEMTERQEEYSTDRRRLSPVTPEARAEESTRGPRTAMPRVLHHSDGRITVPHPDDVPFYMGDVAVTFPADRENGPVEVTLYGIGRSDVRGVYRFFPEGHYTYEESIGRRRLTGRVEPNGEVIKTVYIDGRILETNDPSIIREACKPLREAEETTANTKAAYDKVREERWNHYTDFLEHGFKGGLRSIEYVLLAGFPISGLLKSEEQALQQAYREFEKAQQAKQSENEVYNNEEMQLKADLSEARNTEAKKRQGYTFCR